MVWIWSILQCKQSRVIVETRYDWFSSEELLIEDLICQCEMLSGLMRTCDDIAGGQPVFGRQDSLHIGFQNMKSKVEKQLIILNCYFILYEF